MWWIAAWASAAPIEKAPELERAIALVEAQSPDAPGAISDALTAVRKLAEARPDDAKVQLQLGVASYFAELDDAAEQALRRALQLEPTLSEATYYLAQLLGEVGRHEEAAALFGGLADTNDPEFATARYNEGQAYQLAGKHAEAVAAFRKALASDPTDWHALSKIVQLEDALGDRAAREAARTDLYALRDGGTVPELSAKNLYVRDQFVVGSWQVMTLEYFRLVPPDGVVWVFLYHEPGAEPAGRISLGSYDDTTAFARATKRIPADARMYHLDGYGPNSHATYGMYTTLPSYDDIKAQVVQILSGAGRPMSATVPDADPPTPDARKSKRRKER